MTADIKCVHCGKPAHNHTFKNYCLDDVGEPTGTKFTLPTPTRLRYEVWVSSDGSAVEWSRLPYAVHYEMLGKQHALERAEQAANQYAKVVVEEYDDGRDIYLRNVIEYPVK